MLRGQGSRAVCATDARRNYPYQYLCVHSCISSRAFVPLLARSSQQPLALLSSELHQIASVTKNVQPSGPLKGMAIGEKLWPGGAVLTHEGHDHLTPKGADFGTYSGAGCGSI